MIEPRDQTAARLYEAGWNAVLPAPYASLPLIDYGQRVSRQGLQLYDHPKANGKVKE
jgi:hypothetical protein